LAENINIILIIIIKNYKKFNIIFRIIKKRNILIIKIYFFLKIIKRD